MADRDGPSVLTDEQWEVLAPLIEACRPPHKTDHHDLRRTIEAIIWRHDNGAKWRQIPAELGPWWMAAQTFSHWSRLGVWERLLEAARRRGGGIEAGMSFLDGTGIRAHHKAAGAAKKGALQRSATRARDGAVRGGVTAQGPGGSRTPRVAPAASPARRARRTNGRWRRCSGRSSPTSRLDRGRPRLRQPRLPRP